MSWHTIGFDISYKQYPITMKSYIKFLSRNKLYTSIEAVGLAVSLAFVIIIGNYAYQQISVRNEVHDYDRIYVCGMPGSPGLTYGFTEVIKERIPEVESVVRYARHSLQIMAGGNNVSAWFISADENFYEMFPQYEILHGSADMLVGSNVFVSETFANTNGVVVGDVIKVDSWDLNVVGVVADFERSLLPYGDIIINPKTFIIDMCGFAQFDQFGSVITFTKLMPGTDRDEFHKKAEEICKEIYPNVYGSMMFEHMEMHRYDELFFAGFPSYFDMFNKGDMRSLKILILVGVLLLLSAIFNYVNLNIALTGKRAKEMATRRLLGAGKREIFMKYVAESVAFTAICFGAAILLAIAFIPVVNILLNSPDVPIHLSFSSAYVISYILLILVTGTIVGLAPAFLASRFKPVEVIKGSFRAKSKMTFSKVFIILQNALAVFLLSMALVMESQYSKSLDRPMNCNIEDKYYLFASGAFNSDALENELKKLPCVKRIGAAVGVPGFLPGGQFSSTRDGQDILYRLYRMDSTAFNMFRFEILKDYGAPKYNSVWFGEAAFTATGFDDEYHDISHTLSRRTSNCEQVAGVIADFPTNSTNIGSEDYLAICHMRKSDMPYKGLVIETIGDHNEAEILIRDTYEKNFEGHPVAVDASFYIEDYIVRQMEPTRNNLKLIEIFMILSIILSLLGLIAMSTYYASETAKDIAVKKVFGGTVLSETYATVKRYMIMVLVSIFLGIPVAIYASGKYLEQFIYRLDNYWWTFVAATLLTLIFAFGSVIFQTFKAANTSPATELKK